MRVNIACHPTPLHGVHIVFLGELLVLQYVGHPASAHHLPPAAVTTEQTARCR